MKGQRHRLPADAPRGFGGRSIDRGNPIQFRLDGRVISGFHGDTVLSAALAAGIEGLGHHRRQPIGLTYRSAPAISPASLRNDPLRALPMARTPAVDGAEWVTPHRHGAVPGLGSRKSLGLALHQSNSLFEPWRLGKAAVEMDADLAVIGGGVAGMSAALAAARAGMRVTLIEADPELGGHSGLFGTLEGEDNPHESMARLARDVRNIAAITTLLCAHAFAVRPGRVRVHQVDMSSRTPKAQLIDIIAPRIVIATGSIERLPIFAGNRRPGVVGTLEAYELATRYGVWPGRAAVFSTASSVAYRLAMLASDAGIAVNRILDSRTAPASRFIEFSRAYGMVQAPGTIISGVASGKSGSLVVTGEGSAAPLITERVLVNGGWQPDLTLWHVAGGSSRWAEHRLVPMGAIDGIALAGSAAGYLTRRGCIQSGADAIDQLLGRPRQAVDDPQIDPLYESMDGPCPVAAPTDNDATFLDAGPHFLARPAARSKGWIGKVFRPRQASGVQALSQAPQPLAICEVAAGVDLGLIPAEAAGVVAQERVALVPLATPDAEANAPATPLADDRVPLYLVGRFGADAFVVELLLGEKRRLDPGALIYRSPDVNQPLMAVGVVLRQAGEVTYALLNAATARSGQPLSLRDNGNAVPVRVQPQS